MTENQEGSKVARAEVNHLAECIREGLAVGQELAGSVESRLALSLAREALQEMSETLVTALGSYSIELHRRKDADLSLAQEQARGYAEDVARARIALREVLNFTYDREADPSFYVGLIQETCRRALSSEDATRPTGDKE